NVELTGPTSWLERAPYKAHPEKQPISFQDHGNPVRYRSIWVRELNNTNPAGKPAKREFTYASKLLDTYTGGYQRGNEIIEVTREESQLVAKFSGVRFVLFAESATKFFAKTTDFQAEFEAGADGRVQRMYWSVGEGRNAAAKV